MPVTGLRGDLDLECVASFLVLAEEGRYGRAAARLHVSRSTLTKRLEHQVGVNLLRDATEVTGPTPAGTRFAEHAGSLLAAARAAAHEQPPALTLRH